ncbi:TrmH family RNA methyltransferase [Marinospirillum insulare]|uniref:RNA methyltransferase n=1 Tax=Marinospirillum insulare TaxID=217169 RepID=A0ABQ6A2E2_9GAMM|nr:RNA methyltransferase [Marinospirillum insulare]GLR64274.1 RNA methyltransferase [Marinospirillum insulare]
MLSKNQAKSLRALHRKKTRREQGLFLVEGEKVVAELLASNWCVCNLYATAEFIATYQSLIRLSELVLVECSVEELTSVSTLVTNTAALAVVKMPEKSTPPPIDQNSWLLALDGVNDPGNLGSLLRIADWYGIQQVVCSTTTAEVYNPKVIAASKGSFLRVAVSYQPLDSFFSQLPAATPVLGAYLEGESIHHLENCPSSGVILLGSEAQGISQALAAKVTRKITIPAFGEAESLNVGVAAAIICDNLKRLSSTH